MRRRKRHPRPGRPALRRGLPWGWRRSSSRSTRRCGGSHSSTSTTRYYVNTRGRGLVWAFTSVEAANWFPVTRLSHIADGLLFGMRSGWHHLTNVLWHAAATVMLFLFLRSRDGRAVAERVRRLRVRAAPPARGIGRVGGGAQGRVECVLLVPDSVGLCAIRGAPGRPMVLVRAGGLRRRVDGEADDGDFAARVAAAGCLAAAEGARGGRKSPSLRLRRGARSPPSWCSGARARSATSSHSHWDCAWKTRL